MAETAGAAPVIRGSERPWIVAVARSVPALIVGLLATFTGGHSVAFGLIAFGCWAIVAAIAVVITAGGLSANPRLLLVQQAITLIAGVVALLLAAVGAGPLGLIAVIAVFALSTGGIELAAGIQGKGADPLARDRIIAGGATLLLGVLTLVVPPSLDQPFRGADHHPGVLTASTVATGFFGAWAIVIAVLFAIAAVTLRDAGRAVEVTA